jgi:hypothetical protein
MAKCTSRLVRSTSATMRRPLRIPCQLHLLWARVRVIPHFRPSRSSPQVFEPNAGEISMTFSMTGGRSEQPQGYFSRLCDRSSVRGIRLRSHIFSSASACGPKELAAILQSALTHRTATPSTADPTETACTIDTQRCAIAASARVYRGKVCRPAIGAWGTFRGKPHAARRVVGRFSSALYRPAAAGDT